MEDDLEKKSQDLENREVESKDKSDDNEESLEKKLKIAEEKHLRALAEVENQRRRFEKEIKEAIDFGGFSFAKESLALLDNLQRAKKSIQDDEKLKKSEGYDNYLKNIEIIENDIVSIFKKNKITKIDALNKKFDPNFHQAMLELEDEKADPGTIIQEIQSGYMYGERLLRPSMVGISKKKNEEKGGLRPLLVLQQADYPLS